jgi:flavin reductase (DIM6/NTAB) family NADH-FMN oxidoreductase RutF
MGTGFKAIKPAQLQDNTFQVINKDWMLITAGTTDSYNMMTASWGGLGTLWERPVCFCVVRPQRYTYEFMEKHNVFTLTFFTPEYKEMLKLYGAKSGRDIDKMTAAGLTPVVGKSGGIYFQEARLVLECKKLYYQDLEPGNFLDPKIHDNYPNKDYHRMYFGEIKDCLVKE